MVKRLFDIVVSAIALLVFLPLILILIVLVRVKLGAPVFFTQTRPGKDGKPFQMVKFRSMTTAKDADGNLLPDDQRLPKFGKLLRSTSLDELPELWNVLRGDMSLVGPRPLLMQYLDRYTPEQRRRHDVRPGITGWAQVNQGYAYEADAMRSKLEYDLYYLKHCSLWLDLVIVLRTFAVVLRGTGAR